MGSGGFKLDGSLIRSFNLNRASAAHGKGAATRLAVPKAWPPVLRACYRRTLPVRKPSAKRFPISKINM